MSTEHKILLDEIVANASPLGGHDTAKYLGTTHKIYRVSIPALRVIAKRWTLFNRSIIFKKFIAIIGQLLMGDSREEKVLASMIFGNFPKFLIQVPAYEINRWMGELTGWEEVDSFCDEIDVWLRAGSSTRVSLLKKWNKDKQIEKRRASLVVLCSSVRQNDSEIFCNLSFSFIDALKAEKHVMITKAISWLLRSLIKYHKTDVIRYLRENASSLPSIAVREVTTKLETGRK